MKTITQKPRLLKFLDSSNTLGVQLRIWEISNNTEIIVRIENQNNKSSDILWKDGEKNLNNGQVSDKVLHFLQELKIIKDQKNWTSSAHHTGEITEMDEYEDGHNCIYYVFFVQKHLINF